MTIETKYLQHLMDFLPNDDSTPFQRDDGKLYMRFDRMEIELAETETIRRYYWLGEVVVTQTGPRAITGDTLDLHGFDARMRVQLL